MVPILASHGPPNFCSNLKEFVLGHCFTITQTVLLIYLEYEIIRIYLLIVYTQQVEASNILYDNSGTSRVC